MNRKRKNKLMKRRSAEHRPQGSTRHSGFTLVEMLVAVTLILLMMSMFASIFSIASSSVSKQRGIAENDQRARSLTTILRSDFQKRTVRYSLPYYPGESPETSPTPFTSRPGYFYISTNDPFSGLDDKIQFTIDADLLIENRDSTPFFGRADLLGDRTTNTSTALGAAPPGTLATAINPNQPDVDDGALVPNSTGSSNLAEVTIFVRNGNLYRRVTLIRKPLEVAGKDFGPQPTTSFGDNMLAGLDGSGTYDGLFALDGDQDGSVATPAVAPDFLSNNYLTHFDYSAIAGNPGGNQYSQLIGISALSNDPTSNGGANISLGVPLNRFGFSQFTGLSREHTSVGLPFFIGGFTHAETSARNFNWPQQTSLQINAAEDAGAVLGNGNPYDVINTPVTLNAGNGIIADFDEDVSNEGRGGSRRFEDLLLANVHEFKVELWDERLQKFVTPGHTSSIVDPSDPSRQIAGDYNRVRNLNPQYGPLGNNSLGRVFDTWHPSTAMDIDASGTVDPNELQLSPPYIAYSFHPPRSNDTLPGPSSSLMAAPSTEQPSNRGYWAVNTDYNIGDVVFVPWVDQPSGGNPPDGLFSYSEMPEPKFQIAYRCIVAGNSGAVAPTWPTASGRRVSNNAVVWESFDNRRPLQAVRLTIRFLDQTTDNMRQVSLVMPLTDKDL